jgi:hypothetical protein
MDVSPEDLRQVCDRFRVLIIGRQNAGKTTILEKMTGSEEGAMPEFANKGTWWYELPSLIYVSLIVKLNIGQARTRQGRLGGLWIGAYICSPSNQIPAWMSMIDYEITYPNNPRFVFHNSRRIEAGAESDSGGTEADDSVPRRHAYHRLCSKTTSFSLALLTMSHIRWTARRVTVP